VCGRRGGTSESQLSAVATRPEGSGEVGPASNDRATCNSDSVVPTPLARESPPPRVMAGCGHANCGEPTLGDPSAQADHGVSNGCCAGERDQRDEGRSVMNRFGSIASLGLGAVLISAVTGTWCAPDKRNGRPKAPSCGGPRSAPPTRSGQKTRRSFWKEL
jgi:hypothetical protein